jgi:putative ABC transport system permease protein
MPAELWRILLLEAAIVRGTGCLTGVLAGMLGHRLLARWLALTTGYPAPFSLGAPQIVAVVGSIPAAALLLIAIAGAGAAHVDQRIALRR